MRLRTNFLKSCLALLLLAPVGPDLYAACSKLSIHTSMLNGGNESMTFIQQAKPNVVKLFLDFSRAADIKAASPDTVIIGRVYIPSQPQNGNAAQRAQEWWNAAKSQIQAYPQVDYWEGYNEPIINSTSDMSWYNTFETTRIQILRDNNRKACIGNFSVGTPELSYWPSFYGAIDTALDADGILCLHEYGAPTVDAAFDHGAGEGWLAGRYRKVYRNYLQPTGREIPLAITEAGIDKGITGSCGSPENCDGWRHNNMTAQQYIDQMAWYDSIMRQDDYVIGATIFAIEIYGWASFDLTGDAINRLTSHVQNNASNCNPARDASVLEWEAELPRFMRPNETKSIKVKARNTGTWTWTYSAAYRLGAGGANDFSWSNFACGGYSLSPTNSRAYLCGSTSRGNEREFSFSIQAPGYNTNADLEVQMVRDGVAWFGEKEKFPITVNSCASSCSQCIFDARTDILPFYQSSGWNIGCWNRDNVLNNWCGGLDPTTCNNLKAGQCKVECN